MITKKDLEEYMVLQKAITATKKKIAYYKKKYPHAMHGKVRGSSSQYPYIEQNFTVSGGGYEPNGMSQEKINQRIRDLTYKLQSELAQYERKKLEIEEFLSNIDDLHIKLLFNYVYVDGLSQEEAGELVGLEQSGVSKKLSRYIKRYIK
jgi:hypothetical protein